MITIGSNIPAIRAINKLDQNSRALQSTFTRLSSGLRINRASDDAAGLSIAASLSVQTRVFTQAVRNGNDGLSALAIADGAMSELSNVTMRIRELAEQASNGTLSGKQRLALDQEAQQLSREYTRIMQTTVFNNQNLLDGTITSVSLQIGSDSSTNSQIQAAFGTALGCNAGTGSFAPEVSYAAAGAPAQIAVGDFNGDGKNDMASISGSGGNTVVYFGNGDGTYGNSLTLPDGAAFSGVAGDLNGDGYDDIVINGAAGIHFGNSDGTFRGVTLGAAGSSSILFDVDGNGSLDIVYDNPGSFVGVLLNNGNGTFQGPRTFALSGAGGDHLATGDFNSDGRTDLAVSLSSSVHVFLNVGGGSFAAERVYYAIGSNILGVGSSDFNGDGYDDIIASGQAGNAELLLANSNGSFKAAVAIASSTDNDGGYLTTADFNDDGYFDYARLQTTTGLNITFGNGDGTFKNAVSSVISATVGFMTAADLNGDGAIDLAVAAAGVGKIGLLLENSIYKAGLHGFSLRTAARAKDALDAMSEAIKSVALARGTIGSTQARLSAAISNLENTKINYTSALSAITDSDVAEESAQLVRRRLLQQAGAALLAQASQEPALALKLLQQ